VNIVSAEQAIFSGEAEMVVAPGEAGELGILPQHAPLLTRIRPGTVKVKLSGGSEEMIYVSGGILEVQPKALTILADTSVRAADLDEVKVMEAKRAAEEALANRQSGQERAVVQAELAQLAAQLAAIRKLRK
jgi:F-type H+-transporting ATPase subunit epsilon